MRKIVLLVASLMVVSVVVAAQHPNDTEKVVKVTITLANDVMVGTATLPAGEYKVACDRENITFRRTDSNKDALVVPCTGRELPNASPETTLQVKVDASGTRVLDKLLLRGSAIEHVF